MEESNSSGIEQLEAIITDPLLRKAFAADPEGTLEDRQVDLTGVPQPLLQALFDMSHEELRALARVRQSLYDAGVSPEDTMRIV